MYPGDASTIGVDRPAVVLTGSGLTLTWGDLDDRSSRLANLWHDQGLRAGDHVALLAGNCLEFAALVWAAERSGLHYTPINSHLNATEVAVILGDCGARSLVTDAAHAVVAAEALTSAPLVETVLCIADPADGTGPAPSHERFVDYETALASARGGHPDPETAGAGMLYSSGTTGTPKGVLRPLSGRHPGDIVGIGLAMQLVFGGREGMRYLSPAPLYHSAPLSFLLGTHRLGGTVYVMERFDAEAALAAIDRYRITHSQWVPTMFNRMLRLPADVRDRYDLSSHECAVHGAAPCPIPLKRRMIDWWGPIIWEYYAGTEGPGSTVVSSDEWLRKPGTVGRLSTATVHILDDDGNEVPPGEAGTIYFESETAASFTYHGDPAKTSASRTAQGWATMGDIGYLDEDGYLFLTDRQAFTIISGGVNVYPQEAENVLSGHPAVADVAVFGVPDDDLGEVPMAVVQPVAGVDPTPQLATELLAYCRDHLATIKCPRTVEFEAELPRLPTGKLSKAALRDRYRTGSTDA